MSELIEDAARIIGEAQGGGERWDDLAGWYQEDCREAARALERAGLLTHTPAPITEAKGAEQWPRERE